MDLARGIIEIEGERFYPGYTFDDFKRSRFYTDQDGILYIQLDHPIHILNHTFIITICFMDYELDLLLLCCIDKEIPFDREIERKNCMSRFLQSKDLLRSTTILGDRSIQFMTPEAIVAILLLYITRRAESR